MPAIFWLQCLVLASSSRAWPAPTMLNSDAPAPSHSPIFRAFKPSFSFPIFQRKRPVCHVVANTHHSIFI